MSVVRSSHRSPGTFRAPADQQECQPWKSDGDVFLAPRSENLQLNMIDISNQKTTNPPSTGSRTNYILNHKNMYVIVYIYIYIHTYVYGERDTKNYFFLGGLTFMNFDVLSETFLHLLRLWRWQRVRASRIHVSFSMCGNGCV